MRRKNILIIGGNSDIGLAIGRGFAKLGNDIQLTTRSNTDMESKISDIMIRHDVDINIYKLDILKYQSFDTFIKNLDCLPDIVVCCVGLLGNQIKDQKNIQNIQNIMRTNYEGPSILLEKFSEKFLQRGYGDIIGISSIAGIRGRRSNYIYGSAKSGLNSYLSGLRSKLNPYKINVITVLPGFVYTKMTKDLCLPRFLTSSVEEIATQIINGYVNNKSFVYSNFKWKIISLIISLIPEFIFKRLKF